VPGAIRVRGEVGGATNLNYDMRMAIELMESEGPKPPPEEVFKRIATRTPVDLDLPAADLIREARREVRVASLECGGVSHRFQSGG
jgi:hypothetical protein